MINIYYKDIKVKASFAFLRFTESLYEVLSKKFNTKIIYHLDDTLDYENDIFITFNYSYLNKDLNKIKKHIYISSEPLLIKDKSIINNDEIIDLIKRKNFSLIFDYTNKNINLINKITKTKTFFTPLYYSKYLENIYPKNKIKKDIDILFFGYENRRRRKLKYKLNRISKKVVFVNLYDYNELLNYINRSKIVIIIHMYEKNKPIDTFRINILLSNKVFIIHESIDNDCFNDHKEFNKYIIFSEYNNLPITCKKYLNISQEERDNLSNKTYNWIKNNHSFDKYIPFDEINKLLSTSPNLD